MGGGLLGYLGWQFGGYHHQHTPGERWAHARCPPGGPGLSEGGAAVLGGDTWHLPIKKKAFIPLKKLPAAPPPMLVMGPVMPRQGAPTTGHREGAELWGAGHRAATLTAGCRGVPPACHQSQPFSFTMCDVSMMNFPSLYFWLLSKACSWGEGSLRHPPTPPYSPGFGI